MRRLNYSVLILAVCAVLAVFARIGLRAQEADGMILKNMPQQIFTLRPLCLNAFLGPCRG